MNPSDLKLLEKFAEQDPELKELWNDHILYEKQLEKLESKVYLTPQEEFQMKQLKKQKLEGKTRMQALFDKYKAGSAN